MTFEVRYINVLGNLITDYVLCESCHISNNNFDGYCYLVFKIGSDIVHSYLISTLVSCKLYHGLNAAID